jgi:hypothetical protein
MFNLLIVTSQISYGMQMSDTILLKEWAMNSLINNQNYNEIQLIQSESEEESDTFSDSSDEQQLTPIYNIQKELMANEGQWSASLYGHDFQEEEENLNEEETKIYLWCQSDFEDIDMLYKDIERQDAYVNIFMPTIDPEDFFEKQENFFAPEKTNFAKSGFLGEHSFYFAPQSCTYTDFNKILMQEEESQNKSSQQKFTPTLRRASKMKTVPPKSTIFAINNAMKPEPPLRRSFKKNTKNYLKHSAYSQKL